MKKIVITGANGYIGSHLTKEMLDAGYEVTAIDINNGRIDSRANYKNIDLYNPDTDLYTELGKPDIVMHFACKDVPVHNSLYHVEYIYKNFLMIKKLIDSGLKHIVTVGSMHDVGYWEGAIDENTPTNPRTFYGVSKDTLRRLVEIYTSDKDVCYQHLRFYYTYGDDEQSSGSIFSKILQMSKEGKDMFPFTDGKNKFDYIEIHELAKQIRMAVEQNEICGIINCCSGEPVAIGEMVDNFIKNHHLKIKPQYGAYPKRAYDSPAVWGDNSKIKKIMEQHK